MTERVKHVPPPQDGKIHFQTPCHGCFFAEKDDSNVQIGCQFGLLEKFAQHGGEILDVYNENNDKYKLIKYRRCQFGRSQAWADGAKKKFGHDDNLFVRARQEVTVKVSYLVYVNKTATMEDVIKTAKAIDKQSLPACEIIFMNIAHILPHFFLQLNDILENTKWSMEYIMKEEKETDEETLDMCISFVSKKIKGTFYTVHQAGYEPNKDVVLKLDKYINEELGRLVMVLPDDQNNEFLCHTGVLLLNEKHVPRKNIIEKAMEMAENEQCQNMIKTQDEFHSLA